jgi:hypothetical protein
MKNPFQKLTGGVSSIAAAGLAAVIASSQAQAEGGFGAVVSVPTIQALRESRLPNPAPTEIHVEGYYRPGDGGGGAYFPRPNNGETDDGGSVIVGADQVHYMAETQEMSDLRRWGAKTSASNGGADENVVTIHRALVFNLRHHQPLVVHGQFPISKPIVVEGDGWTIVGGAPFGGGGPQDGFFQTDPNADIIEVGKSTHCRLADLRLTGHVAVVHERGAGIHVTGRVTHALFENLYITYLGAGLRLTSAAAEISLSSLRHLTVESCRSGLYADDNSQFYNNDIGPVEVGDADEHPISMGLGTQNSWQAIHLYNTRNRYLGKPVKGEYTTGTKVVRIAPADAVHFAPGQFVMQNDTLPRRITRITPAGLELEQGWTRSWSDDVILVVAPSSGVMFRTVLAQQTVSGLNIEWHAAKSCVQAGLGGEMVITSMHAEGWCPTRSDGPAYLFSANVQVGSLELYNTILDAGAVKSVGLFGNANGGEIGNIVFNDVEVFGSVYMAPLLFPAPQSGNRVSIHRTRFVTSPQGWWHDAPMESSSPFALERVGDRQLVSRTGDLLTVYTERVITNHGSWTPGDRQVVGAGETTTTLVCQGVGGTFGALPGPIHAWIRPGAEYGYFDSVNGLYPREWVTVEGRHVRIAAVPRGAFIPNGGVKLGAASAQGAQEIQVGSEAEAAKFATGDAVAIGIGGPDEEHFRVQRVDRFERTRVFLDRPLAHEHPAGTPMGTAVLLDRPLGGNKPAANAEVSLTAPRFAVVQSDRN